MKYLNIFCLISCLIIFDSCRKEEATTLETIVETETPTEVEYPVFVGSVSNQGEGIANATVKIYQPDGLKGEVSTKEDGSFSTIGIVLDENKDVTFGAEKQEYTTTYKRRSSDLSQDEFINLSITRIDQLTSPYPGPLSNPADPNLISLTGQVESTTGTTATGLIAYDIVQQSGSTWGLQGGLFHTDQDGYFEILVPINTEFNYVVWEGDCNIKITGNDEIIFSYLESEKIGPFTTDLQLPTLVDDVEGPFEIYFYGEILECDGSPAFFPEVKIHYFDNADIDIISTMNADSLGNYSFQKEICSANEITVELWAIDAINNLLTDTITLTQSMLDGGLHLVPLAACNEGFPGFSTMTLTTGGTTHEYNQIITRLEDGNIVSENVGFTTVLFTVQDAQIGDNEMLNYVSYSWVTGNSFEGVEGTIILTLTDLTEDHAEGTFTGSFKNSVTEEITQGTGTLDLVF